MNKRGVTLIEIVIAVTLTSIVLIFLVDLLLDFRNNDESTMNNNNITRTEIVYTIQNDLHKHYLNKITGNNFHKNTVLNLEYLNMDGSANNNSSITLFSEDNNNYFLYTEQDGTKHKWEIKNSVIDKCVKLDAFENSVANMIGFKLTFNVYQLDSTNNNSASNNDPSDDIEIVYIREICVKENGCNIENDNLPNFTSTTFGFCTNN